jgi:hypothetical protein
MQEIYIDSDSLDELQLVIQDIFSKRKRVYVNGQEAYFSSHLIMKVRICMKNLDETDPNQKEIILIDLSEINEPIEILQNMFVTLESNTNSFSLESRICQQVFEKLRKMSSFKILSFINQPNEDTRISPDKSESQYALKLIEFAKTTKDVLSRVSLQYHSRLNISDAISTSNDNNSSVASFVQNVFPSFNSNKNMSTKNQTTKNQSSIARIKFSNKSKNSAYYSVGEDSHQNNIVNKISSNILRELKVQKLQNKELKIPSERLPFERESNISNINRINISKGSSFCSNILGKSDYKYSVGRMIDLRVETSDLIFDDKENKCSNKQFHDIKEESKSNTNRSKRSEYKSKHNQSIKSHKKSYMIGK